MPQLLIVYKRETGDVTIDRYDDDARQLAQEHRFGLEIEHRLEPHIEVVLLRAPSEDVIRRTHARYFKTGRELVESA
jgi:hypothetical protein